MIPGERHSLQGAISYDAVFNCLLDSIAKGALRCKTRIEWSVREFEDMGTHPHRSRDSGHWGVLGTVGGFESISTFAPEVFLAIVNRLSRNIAPVMTVLMPAALLSMALVLFLSFNEGPRAFYLTMAGFALFLAALLITIIVEVPIVKQIETWRVSNLPGNSQELAIAGWRSMSSECSPLLRVSSFS